MELIEGEYGGRRTAAIESDALRLEFLLDAGPRIVRLVAHERPFNLLSETPELAWDTRYGERYEIVGGHRVWVSPEAREEDQVPDGRPVEVVVEGDIVRVVGGTLSREGMRAEIAIRMDGSRVSIANTLRNEGDAPQTVAAWSITAFAPGGVATLPQPTAEDPGGPQLPSRHFVLWPYSSLRDARVSLGDDIATIAARATGGGPFKLGYFDDAGWLSYERDGVRFTKSFAAAAGETYPDRGCNAEAYVCDTFIELESLSPVRTVAPGETIEQTETWLVEVVGERP